MARTTQAKPKKTMSLRERVLDAAENIVSRQGAGFLTLDAVAAGAKVSKGGMLYHFKSKEALLEGLLDRALSSYGDRVASLMEAMPGSASEKLGRAHIVDGLNNKQLESGLATTLIAAAAYSPQLLAPAREAITDGLKSIESLEKDIPMARIFWFAVQGMNLLNIFGVSPLTTRQADSLRKRITAAINVPVEAV